MLMKKKKGIKGNKGNRSLQQLDMIQSNNSLREMQANSNTVTNQSQQSYFPVIKSDKRLKSFLEEEVAMASSKEE